VKITPKHYSPWIRTPALEHRSTTCFLIVICQHCLQPTLTGSQRFHSINSSHPRFGAFPRRQNLPLQRIRKSCEVPLGVCGVRPIRTTANFVRAGRKAALFVPCLEGKRRESDGLKAGRSDLRKKECKPNRSSCRVSERQDACRQQDS
jgi:hypothetical protein